MSLRYDALNLLSDGNFHSGARLGGTLGVSRTAVWKQLRALSELGLDIYAVPGKGYRLAHPIELLDARAISQAMSAESRALLGGLELHPRLDSTNTYLMQRAAGGLPSGHACFAEYQTAGRGRRGRQWVSPFAANIYLSVLWRFTLDPAQLGGLGLAVGVGMIRALRAAGVADLSLKWPNDLLWQGRKLAGILLEMSGESFGASTVVTGLGVNCRMPKEAGSHITQAWADLEEALGERLSRNTLAGGLLSHVLIVLRDYQRHGLAPFLDEWRDYDAVRGKTINLQLPNENITGVAAGVDRSGALLLSRDGATQRYLAGEISVRIT